MIVSAVVAALLLQAAPAPARQAAAPAKASVAGVVVHAISGDPIPNVKVSLARTDAALGAFAEMVAGDHPPVEMTIPAEFLAIMAEEMANASPNGEVGPRAAAEAKAMSALNLADIQELIVSPNGSVAVISKLAAAVTTDSEGRFVFTDVEPGTYKAIFAANGYARQDYGQRGPGGAGAPIVLTAGQAKRDIVMRLNPVSAVSGRIFDRAQRPIAGVPVQLFRFAYNEAGQKTMQRAASVQTDDRGAYRIYYLTPGRYYLSAGNQPGRSGSPNGLPPEMAAIANAIIVSSNRIPQNYALSYYPGVADLKNAIVIDVQPGADLEDLNLSLDVERLYRIRGHVLDPRSGQPPQNANISMRAQTTDSADIFAGSGNFAFDRTGPNYNPADGTFELRNVSPGAYTVMVDLPVPPNPRLMERQADLANMSPAERQAFFESMQSEETARPRAIANINVVNADIDDVVLLVANAGSISGKAQIDENTAPPEGGFVFLRVQLRTANADALDFLDGRLPQTRLPLAEGGFKLDAVWPGEYRLVVAGLPTGYYVKQARLGDSDVLNEPFRYTGADPGALEIVIGKGAGYLEGATLDARGQPVPGAQVVLIPSNHERTELFRPVTADPAGRFSIPAITPGNYKLAAWEDIEPFAFFDPDLIKQAEENGKPVHVGETFRETLNVNPLPLPERK